MNILTFAIAEAMHYGGIVYLWLHFLRTLRAAP
jgi:hypothetical protein